MLLLYALTLFVSAYLLFLIQPMFARMALPLLGGSPAVWNTAMLFFQGSLLLGYMYAQAGTRRIGPQRQWGLHAALMLLPLPLLPIALPAGWTPPVESNPTPWLLTLMAVSVGLPFLVVSASSPLLQSWFAATSHPAARDPYFLYASSNAGSMLALLSYPVLVEPHLTLEWQSRAWAAGYLVLVAMTVACGICLRLSRKRGGAAVPDSAVVCKHEAAPVPLRRFRWVLLALAPASLMVGITTYLSTDLAAVPLLWVIPLCLYLLTFILVFARRPPLPHALMCRAACVLIVAVAMLLAMRATEPIALLMVLHLLCFFAIAMVCHGELARDRPAPHYLGEFFTLMSLGGVLGGAFNALLAPALFTTLAEYPITLVLACLLIPAIAARVPAQSSAARGAGVRRPPSTLRTLDVALPAGLALGLLLLANGCGRSPDHVEHLPPLLLFGLPALVCYGFSQRPVRFALGIGALLVAGALYPGDRGRVEYAERSFFGIHTVTGDAAGRFRQLIHGHTLHGRQSLNPALRREPASYYSRSGPIGQVFKAMPRVGARPVGVVGLGVGSLACYAAPGEDWTFYEIDPVVARIARDPRYFTFLADCRARVQVVLGDARLSLAEAPRQHFGLLVQDAYSSDSIPVHLLTREALRLYLEKLAPGGLLAFHISNRHLDLKPVLAGLASDARLTGLVQDDESVSTGDGELGKTPSTWVVMARRESDLTPLVDDARWQKLSAPPGARVWTDSYSSILSVLARH